MCYMVEQGRKSKQTRQKKPTKTESSSSSFSPPGEKHCLDRPFEEPDYFEAVKTFATSEAGDSLVSLGHFAIPD